MIRELKILINQKYPARFLMSRLIRESGLWRFMKIRSQGYSLHLHPASLAMSQWVDKNDRYTDVKILKSILRSDETYVDVGANIGRLAIEASLIVGRSGKVFAFEAHPRTAYFLHSNIWLNKLSNIRVVQAAVGEHFGWVGFSDIRSDDENKITPEGEITVPVITLDEFLPLEAPILLKIDVEGYEKFVLQGASSLLDRTKFIFFEAWDEHYEKNGYSFKEVFDFLKDKKFHLAKVDISLNSVSAIHRDDKIPVCINLLAYRDREELETRTGWSVEAGS